MESWENRNWGKKGQPEGKKKEKEHLPDPHFVRSKLKEINKFFDGIYFENSEDTLDNIFNISQRLINKETLDKLDKYKEDFKKALCYSTNILDDINSVLNSLRSRKNLEKSQKEEIEEKIKELEEIKKELGDIFRYFIKPEDVLVFFQRFNINKFNEKIEKPESKNSFAYEIFSSLTLAVEEIFKEKEKKEKEESIAVTVVSFLDTNLDYLYSIDAIILIERDGQKFYVPIDLTGHKDNFISYLSGYISLSKYKRLSNFGDDYENYENYFYKEIRPINILSYEGFVELLTDFVIFIKENDGFLDDFKDFKEEINKEKIKEEDALFYYIWSNRNNAYFNFEFKDWLSSFTVIKRKGEEVKKAENIQNKVKEVFSNVLKSFIYILKSIKNNDIDIKSKNWRKQELKQKLSNDFDVESYYFEFLFDLIIHGYGDVVENHLKLPEESAIREEELKFYEKLAECYNNKYKGEKNKNNIREKISSFPSFLDCIGRNKKHRKKKNRRK